MIDWVDGGREFWTGSLNIRILLLGEWKLGVGLL